MRRTLIVVAFSALGFALAPATAMATEHTYRTPEDPFRDPIGPGLAAALAHLPDQVPQHVIDRLTALAARR